MEKLIGLLRRAPKLTAIVPIVVGLVICLEVRSGIGRRRREERIEDPRYLVARRELPAGQPVTAIDFTFASKAALGEAPPGALTDQELHLLHGATTRAPLRAGECLTRAAVRSIAAPETLSKKVPRGMRAYSIDPGGTLELSAGDHVDVLLSPHDEKDAPFVLVEGALILKPATDGEVVVAVSSAQIQILEKARRQGKLTVALRNPMDDSPGRPESNGSRGQRRRRPAGNHRSIEIFSEGE